MDDAVETPVASAAAPRGRTSVLRHRLELGGGAVRRRWAASLTVHVALVPLIYLAAFALRFDGDIEPRYLALYAQTAPWLVLVRLVTLFPARLHSARWRYTGLSELLELAAAVTAGTLLFTTLLFLSGLPPGYPRSVLILDWLLSLFVYGGARAAVRGVREVRRLSRHGREARRALVLGTGELAVGLLRQLRTVDQNPIAPVGLLAEDPVQVGTHVCGVPVLGTAEDLRALAARHRARLLIVATESIRQDRIRQLARECSAAGLAFSVVPPLPDVLAGRVAPHRRRELHLEGLLGRDAVELDMEEVRRRIEGRTVLVTGGAGSIGSELARHIAMLEPRRLVLVDQAESRLYFTQIELAQAHPSLDLVAVVASVVHRRRLAQIFAQHRPDFVFHAAAYKHVPLMETNIAEAIRNNVVGTLNAARCAAAVGSAVFLLISTDKAVRPSSIMGATKRIAERLILGLPALAAANTDYRAVRFGNVLGSDGSVLPLFERQLAAGRPLPVTDPKVTRYFMTTTEAVQLVLRASTLPEASRRICMLEMGEPVRILDLAEGLVRLSGLEPYRDVQIQFTGMRPGEKLHEELTSMLEQTVPSSVDRIRIVQAIEADGDEILRGLTRLARALDTADDAALLDAIRALVPECVEPLKALTPAQGLARAG